jgi:hypothetical protein
MLIAIQMLINSPDRDHIENKTLPITNEFETYNSNQTNEMNHQSNENIQHQHQHQHQHQQLEGQVNSTSVPRSNNSNVQTTISILYSETKSNDLASNQMVPEMIQHVGFKSDKTHEQL